MRGWERVGQVAPDGFIRFSSSVDDSDILVFQAPGGYLRCGATRARYARVWLGHDCGVTALAPLDHVYRATAIGEHAFRKHGSPSSGLRPAGQAGAASSADPAETDNITEPSTHPSRE